MFDMETDQILNEIFLCVKGCKHDGEVNFHATFGKFNIAGICTQ
jgi:hypothetical protein